MKESNTSKVDKARVAVTTTITGGGDMEHRTRLRESTRPPKPLIPTPMRGDAHTLFKMSRTAKLDIQGFIAGQYKAKNQIGHELTKPTGTKFVFHLCLADDDGAALLSPDAKAALEDCVNGVDEDEATATGESTPPSTIDEEDDDDISSCHPATKAVECSKLEHDRKVRLMRSHGAPSLAEVIARAEPNDFPLLDNELSDSDTTSGYGEDFEDITRRVDYHFASLGASGDDPEDTSTPSAPATIAAQGHGRSPPDTMVDIAYPRNSDQKGRISRHDGKVSLASLIASAKDEDSPMRDILESDYHSGGALSPPASPSLAPQVSYNFVLRPCHDPHFPGHSPCHSHEQRPFGRSAASAVRVLRHRFEILHQASGHVGVYKDWHVAKWETGATMVHGPSSLRNEITYEEGGEIEDDETEFSTSALPTMAHGGAGDGCSIMSSSSFETDVEGHPAGVGQEPDALGICEDYDDEFVFDENDTPLSADIVQVSSSPFDEIVDEYNDSLEAEEAIILPDDGVAFETPSGQVAAEGEVLQDMDSDSDRDMAEYLDKVRNDQAARAGRERIKVFNNALREHHHKKSSSEHNIAGPIILKLCKSIINDADSIGLSARTSVFSNRTSILTKSSYESVRVDYSRLIDALDLEIDADGCTVCMSTLRGFSVATIAQSNTNADHVDVDNDKKRVVSLPVVSSAMRTEHALDDLATLPSADQRSSTHQSPARLRQIVGAPDTPDRIGFSIDNFLTYMSTSEISGEEFEGAQPCGTLPVVNYDSKGSSSTLVSFQAPSVAESEEPDASEDVLIRDGSPGQETPIIFERVHRNYHRHLWVGKMRERVNNIPNKAQQTGHRCVKSAKQFAMTVRHFVPAALAACYRSKVS